MAVIAREDITGLVLAGGPGRHGNGADKGLQNHNGMPLALHALLRLQWQVGAAMISANRNLSAYESMGVPVWPDSMEGYIGPLAGLLTGLEHAETGWLVTVPCDAAVFHDDLVERLAKVAVEQEADIAVAATHEHGQLLARPAFCLLRIELAQSLAAFLHAGGREFGQWAKQHRMALVPIDAP